MIPKAFEDRIRNVDDFDHDELWEELYKSRKMLEITDLPRLFEYAIGRPDDFDGEIEPDVRRRAVELLSAIHAELAAKAYFQIPHAYKLDEADSLSEFIWQPFLPIGNDLTATAIHSAVVVSISDSEHINDMPSLSQLCRHLSFERFGNVDIQFLPLDKNQQEWGHLRLVERRAACFVGRSSLFDIFKRIRDLSHGRFILPESDANWRGKPVSETSIAEYHHVRDLQSGKKYLVEQAPDGTGKRVDYATVRLVRIDQSPGHLDVLLISGATSLATFGASQWVVSPHLKEFRFEKLRGELDRNKELRSNGIDIEFLLRVEATAYQPKRQWVVESCQLMKICVNGHNVIRRIHGTHPKCVTVIASEGTPNVPMKLLFDDDPIIIGGETSKAVFDVCWQFAKNGSESKAILKGVTTEKARDQLRIENLRSAFEFTQCGKDCSVSVKRTEDGQHYCCEFTTRIE